MRNSFPDDSMTRLWDELDPGEPPTHAMIADAGRLKRRRRLVVAAGSLGVAAAMTAGLVVAQLGEPDRQPPPSLAMPPGSAARPAVHAEVIRGATHYDYRGFADISEGVDETAVSFAGYVVGWSEGRTLRDETDVSLTAVLQIRVLEQFKVPGSFGGTDIYVEVPRGGYVVDENGEEFQNPGARRAYRTIDELNTAIPKGVRVIVLGNVAPSDAGLEQATPGSKVLASGSGYPESANLVAPYPQGLVFETQTGGVTSGMDHGNPVAWGWLDKSVPASERFEELVGQAR